MIYITRRERFSAAHMLWNYNWNNQKNIEVFGKCANKNWHGHNFELFVTVKGEVNTDTGFVVNLKDLAKIIQEKVIDKLDHKNLNLDVDFMKDKMVSTEVLAIAIWEELEANIMQLGATLHCIKVQETENNFVEYFGK
jgi:6-pyruvoyltetrahydropterin/6-carboxytetrahydropterin synthase